MSAVTVSAVSKAFRVYRRPSDHLKEILTLGRRSFHGTFEAVRNVTFEVDHGTCLGIIGENGSGKSTLLGMIAGVIRPTTGTVAVTGRRSALLELGAGFNPEFTGRDNVFLNAAILGLTDAETQQRMPLIEAYAEIGPFIDRPVKTYSSGMFVRLAFAVAVHVDPEVLIVDEALSVGDIYFQQRCIRKIHAMKDDGVTILFVSHDLGAVRSLADRTIWMERGEMKMSGPTAEVAAQYLSAMIMKGNRDSVGTNRAAAPRGSVAGLEFHAAALDRIPAFIDHLPNVDRRFGDGRARIVGIGVFNDRGDPAGSVGQGDRICVRVSLEFVGDVERPNVGFMLRNRLGEDVFGTNVLYEGESMERAGAGDRVSADFVLDFPHLRSGYYYLCPAVADGTIDDYRHCDWVDNAFALEVVERSATYGHMRVPVRAAHLVVSRSVARVVAGD